MSAQINFVLADHQRTTNLLRNSAQNVFAGHAGRFLPYLEDFQFLFQTLPFLLFNLQDDLELGPRLFQHPAVQLDLADLQLHAPLALLHHVDLRLKRLKETFIMSDKSKKAKAMHKRS